MVNANQMQSIQIAYRAGYVRFRSLHESKQTNNWLISCSGKTRATEISKQFLDPESILDLKSPIQKDKFKGSPLEFIAFIAGNDRAAKDTFINPCEVYENKLSQLSEEYSAILNQIA